MPIAQFPDFTIFDYSLKTEYDNIYKQYLPYSDFSFGNLAIWLNQYQDLRLSLLNGNIVVECHNLFEDGKHVLSMLGTNDVEGSFKLLFEYLKDSELPLLLSMVPQETVQALGPTENYEVIQESDNANYILSTTEMARLEGATYGKIRRQVNGFKREYESRYTFKEFDISSSPVVSEVVNHIHQWDSIYTHNDQERQESYVINTSLTSAEELGFKNLSLLIDGQIQAIALYQMVPQMNYVIGNHTKSNHRYRNSFNFLIHKLCESLDNNNIGLLNFEQDLGIPGLREHKRGLRPIAYLQHYSVVPKR